MSSPLDVGLGHGGITLGVRALRPQPQADAPSTQGPRVQGQMTVERRRQEGPAERRGSGGHVRRPRPAQSRNGSSRTTKPTGSSSGGTPASLNFWVPHRGDKDGDFVESWQVPRRKPRSRSMAGPRRGLPPARHRECSRSRTVTARRMGLEDQETLGQPRLRAPALLTQIGLARQKVSKRSREAGKIHISNYLRETRQGRSTQPRQGPR